MHLLYPILVALVGLAAGGSVAFLLFLLCAALAARRCVPPVLPDRPLALAVIVPAHDEELVLAGTLDSLSKQEYPLECFEVVVVADNCADTTAALASSHGVTVLERTHAQDLGKGYALNHAVAHLLSQPAPPEGFVIVDADTWVAPDFLARMSARLQSGGGADSYAAWQGRYGVLNFGESWRAGLMAAAFDLVNHVKPLGREALKLSVGLKGNGMAFTRAVAAAQPWPGGSLTEDLDYGLELARRLGLRVGYAHEARVLAQMPTEAAQAGSQRSRWERGRFKMVRERALPLVWEGLRERNRLLLDMGLDLMVPPLAELGALTLAWFSLVLLGTATHLLPHPAIWLVSAALTGAGLLAYILGGLRVAGAPPEAYTALLRAPFYAAWKFALAFSRMARKRPDAGVDEWVRTERAPLLPEKPTPVSAPALSPPPGITPVAEAPRQ
jgi:1,2-diacylglycerol 3-beta-glucosyltransferase